jgi:thymidylate synthase (FAD)
MQVKLISYSMASKELFDVDNSLRDVQGLIAYCARVSNPNNQSDKKTTGKLIKYLIKNKHWSPLEMVSACIEIETTRDIARQILRHRSFSFQEFSQRYADPKDQGDMFEYSEARLQDTKNRQNSVDVQNVELHHQWIDAQEEVATLAKQKYDWAIENGIAKELARKVLPEGNTVSRMYMNGTLRSWVHYIELRSANGTQKEHMNVAQACAVEIAKIFPLIGDILND